MAVGRIGDTLIMNDTPASGSPAAHMIAFVAPNTPRCVRDY